MTATEIAAPVRSRVLPTGTTGSLWAARPACGVVDFRDRRLRIEVPDSRAVLQVHGLAFRRRADDYRPGGPAAGPDTSTDDREGDSA